MSGNRPEERAKGRDDHRHDNKRAVLGTLLFVSGEQMVAEVKRKTVIDFPDLPGRGEAGELKRGGEGAFFKQELAEVEGEVGQPNEVVRGRAGRRHNEKISGCFFKPGGRGGHYSK